MQAIPEQGKVPFQEEGLQFLNRATDSYFEKWVKSSEIKANSFPEIGRKPQPWDISINTSSWAQEVTVDLQHMTVH